MGAFPLIVCVTGPMAAGKNVASDCLEQIGFVAVDADSLGHIAVENARDSILREFQAIADSRKIALLDSFGRINRRNLGKIVFSDKNLVKKQESIVFPEIEKLLKEFIAQNQGKNIVINATVLYKLEIIHSVDKVLFIDCPKIIRLFRAKKRDKLAFSLILDRFKNQKQLFAKYKASNADIVRVWNIGSRKRLLRKIKVILNKA